MQSLFTFASVLSALVLTAAITHAQEPFELPGRPESYRVIANSDDLGQVTNFVSKWIEDRQSAAKEFEPRIRELGFRYGLKELTADDLVGRNLRGGLRAEMSICLSKPREIAAVAMRGDSAQRTQFANQMWFVDKTEAEFRKGGDGDSELVLASSWARARALFASDFSVKASALGKKEKYRVVVETRDRKSNKAVSGLEVMWALEIFEDDEKLHRPFPKFSTPTEFELPAGIYVFYCRSALDNEIVEGPKRKIHIAADTPVDLHSPKK